MCCFMDVELSICSIETETFHILKIRFCVICLKTSGLVNELN